MFQPSFLPANTREILESNLPPRGCAKATKTQTYSRKELAEIYGIHRNTISEYCEVAYWAVTEFRKDAKSRERTRLSPYQAFVIYVLCFLYRQLDYGEKKAAVTMTLQANPNWVSRETYEALAWTPEQLRITETIEVDLGNGYGEN